MQHVRSESAKIYQLVQIIDSFVVFGINYIQVRFPPRETRILTIICYYLTNSRFNSHVSLVRSEAPPWSLEFSIFFPHRMKIPNQILGKPSVKIQHGFNTADLLSLSRRYYSKSVNVSTLYRLFPVVGTRFQYTTTSRAGNNSGRTYSTLLQPEVPLEIPSKYINPIKYLKWKMNEIDNARRIYELCSSHSLGLEKTFYSWFTSTTLNLYIVQKALVINTNPGSESVIKSFQAELLNHLWLDLEIKLNQLGLKSNIGSVVKDLVSSYQGMILGYDEGLYYGDAILMGAIWRNLYQSQDVSVDDLHRVLLHVKKNLQHCEQIELKSILNSTFTFIN